MRQPCKHNFHSQQLWPDAQSRTKQINGSEGSPSQNPAAVLEIWADWTIMKEAHARSNLVSNILIADQNNRSSSRAVKMYRWLRLTHETDCGWLPCAIVCICMTMLTDHIWQRQASIVLKRNDSLVPTR